MPVEVEGEAYVKQIKDVPGFDGTKAKFPSWKRNFLCLAKLHGLFEVFAAGVYVPVADEGVFIPTLQQHFPGEDIKKHFIAWSIYFPA